MVRTDEETCGAVTVWLPPDLVQGLREYRAFTGTPANDLIERLVREFLAGPGREEIVQAMTGRAKARYGAALHKLADS